MLRHVIFIIILTCSLLGCNDDLGVKQRPVDLCDLRELAEPINGQKYITYCYPKNSDNSEYYKSLVEFNSEGATVISRAHMANVMKMKNEAEKKLKYCAKKLSRYQ